MLNALKKHFRRPKQTKPKLYYDGATQGLVVPQSSISDSTLALEDRILLDAAAVDTAVEHVADVVAQEQAEQAMQNAESGKNVDVQAVGEKDQLLNALSSVDAASSNQIVFVDMGVEDYESLISEIDPKAELIYIDSNSDGLEQVSNVLSEREGIDAIHIISHGDSGQLFLGDSVITADSMQSEHADELLTIKEALSEQADILIYGCNFAEGEEGAEAVSTLSDLTGADVAASTDLTGSSAEGADWDLEVKTGDIETESLVATDWQGTLVEVVNVSGAQTGSYTVTEDGRVDITVTGGDGGNGSSTNGGQGATVTATFDLNAGDVIEFVVGDAGNNGTSSGGGGGSTGVFINDVLVMVAGAGGGGDNSTGAIGLGGQSTINGASGIGAGAGAGGVAGAGGGANTNDSAGGGGITSSGASAAAGGGAIADTNAADGVSLAAGGAGAGGGAGGAGGAGFSGGGGADNFFSGGGGGYSGGGAAGNGGGAGGGGSFVDTTVAGYVSSSITAGSDGGGSLSDGTTVINLDIDSDGDGILNSADLDDDNDGILDSAEQQLTTVTSTLSYDPTQSTATSIVLTDGVATITITDAFNSVISGSNVVFDSTGSGTQDPHAVSITSSVNITSVTLNDLDNFDPDNTTGNPFIDAIAINQAGTWSGVNGAGQLNSYTLDATGAAAAQTDINANAAALGGAGGRTVDFSELIAAGAVSDVLINPDSAIENDYSATYTFASALTTFQLIGDDIVEGDNQLTTINFANITVTYQVLADQDSDGDGVVDRLDLDSDNDGISDLVESGQNAAVVDTDNDGKHDDVGETYTNGVSNDANGGAGVTPIDSDGDGIDDYRDLDSDNDGIADYIEAQTTSPYSANDGDVSNDDSDGDGVIDQFDSDASFGGTFTTPNDHDNDGIADYLDTDSDADGILDINESGLTLSGTDSNNDGIDDGVGASYSNPDGAVTTDSALVLENDDDPAGAPAGNVDFRDDDVIDLVNDTNSVNENNTGNISGNVSTNDPINNIEVTSPATAYSLVSASIGSYGTLTLNANGTYSYNLDENNVTVQALQPGDSLIDVFTYQVIDDDGDTATATLTITINGEDDLPVAVNDTVNATEDTVFNGDVSGNDTLSGDGGNVFSVNTNATNGTVVMNADGTFTYTPNANYNGPDSFTYDLTDADGDVSTATVTINVAPVDDTPVAVNDTVNATEDTVFNGDVSGNDTLSGDGGNVFSVNTNATNGTVVMNADGTFTYTPNANYNGPDSFTYDLTDADGDVSTATVTINVAPVDDTPVAVNDTVNATEDTVFNGDVSGNDTLSGDGGNVFSVNTNATNGTVVMNADGTFTYTPNANYNGPDSFTYDLTDADGDVSTATVTINVAPVDDTPVAVNDTVNATEDTVFNGDVSGNDTLSGDGGNVFSVNTNATNGTVVMNADGTFTYTPNANYNGPDSFTYDLTDADGDVSTATVTINVAPVDDTPVAVNDTVNATEDTVFNGDVSGNDTLSGDGGNVFSVNTNATNGTVVMNADGTFTYTPNANYNGPDSFTYDLTDADGDVSTATVTINVAPVDDTPVAVNDTVNATEDTVFNGDVSGNDTLSGDGGNVFSVNTNATNGTVVMNADGTFTYTPNANYNGPDSFTYDLTDADGDVSTATVTINVAPVDDTPVAVNDTVNATEDTVFNGDVSGNDTLSGDGGNVFSVNTNATNGTVVMNADGTFTYTPNANYNGPDSFTYDLTDADGDVSTATVTINVAPVDDTPVAVNDTVNATEDTVFNGDVSGNDTLSGDGGNVFSVNTNATNGTVVMNADGTFTYTPNANYNGPDSFTYDLTDADGDVSTATVTINVAPVDDTPVAVNDTVNATEDTVFNGDVSGNDTLSGDGGNVFSVNTNATNGTVVMNADGTFTYTPNANYNGPDSFTYDLTDADGDVSTATVTINVAPVDDTPVAVNDTVNATEDTVFNGDVSGNDTLSGDGGNVFSVNTNATNGTVVMNADGTFTYTPNANYNGPDSFTYDLTDADGDVSTATVTINVAPVDDTPVAVNDTVNATEDTVFNGDVSGNDTLSGDGGNVFSVNTNATNGTVVMNADGTFTYTPNANYNGPDSFTYDLTDADGDVSTATVTINVAPVDDTPVAVNDTVNATEDTVFNGDVSGNDTLSGDGGNVFSVNTNATNGTVVMNADGTFTYTPNANYNGPDSFTYDLTDADGDVSTATVTINVAPVDDTPVAVNDTVNATEDTVFNGDVSGNDTLSGDGGNVFSVNTNATNGTVVMNADGTFTYTPNANYNGPDSFTYDLTDADGDVSTATVTINVAPVDDTPVAVNDTVNATEDTVFNGDVSGNDTLSGDGGNVFSVNTNATNGTVVMNADGTFTYTPNANYNGPDSFTYDLTDADGDVSTATVTINVAPVDDTPVAVNDTVNATEDTVFNGDVSGNDTLSGDGGNVFSVNTNATNGTVVMNADGTFTYTPNANYNGPDSFTYDLTDADGDVSTATVTINVAPVDDTPVAVNDTVNATEDTVFNGDVSGNDTLSGDGGNVFSVNTNATNGTVVMNADGTFTYTPNANYNGPDSFTYDLTDADGDVSTATVTINVAPVDDTPVAVNDTVNATEDTVFNGDVSGNDTLSGDGGNVFSVNTNATNGTVVMNADGTFTYTPNANYNGPDSFTYDLTDADGDVSTATVTINVAPVDDTPVAVNDTVNATEDTVFNGDVSGNDTLSGDGGNVFSVNTNATNGTVVMNADGTFTYTPNANYNGPDSFTYDLTDADGDVSTATVTINVAPVDDTPVAVNDTVNATEDTVFNGDVSGNDTLSGDGGNVFSVNTNATNGTVVMNADGTFTYTPNANYNGPDSFTYDLTDADGDVSTATVTINVAPVDDTPVAVNDTVNATEDTVFNGDVSGNDTLSGDGGNVFSVNTNATNGTVVMNADGTFTYTPNANYNGPDSFTYDLTDADGDVSTATVTINVAPVDDTPVAVNDTVNATEDTVFNGDVSGNDTLSGDGGNVFSVNTNATNGTVVMNADGTFTYTPNANYNGPDSFTYDLTDADGDVSTATVTINVAPVDDTPVAVNDTVNATEDTVFNGDVSGNDTLSGDGGNVFSVNTNATNGTVVMNADGTFTYTPNANYNGPDSFTYDLTDADGDVSTATVTINVAPVDDTPVAVNDTVNATEDTVFNGDVSGNDTLSGDGGNVFSVNTNATNGTVVMNADGTFTYTPNANYNGPDSFTYDLTDADGDVSTATVTINVAPVDDTPVAVNDTVNATEDTVFNGDVSGNDTLSGDGGNVFSVNTNATNGTVVMNADGTFTYTPNANYNGPDSFTYDLTDADGDVSTATVTINVAPVDDTPVAVNDTVNATEDTVFNGDVSGNDTLSGDGGNVFSVNTNATNGTVVMNADGTFTYTPNANYNGPDSFTYDLTDADGDVSTATVTINVAPVDDTPVAVNDTVNATEDTVFNGDVSGNDTLSGDGGNVFSVNTNATNGTVVMNADGTFTYTPNANYNGPDSFTYDLTDADGDVSTATVTINVAPVDDTPVAVNDTVNATEDTVFNGDVSGNDTLSGDGGNVFSVNTNATNGTVVMNADGTFTYTPNANYNGPDSFTYDLTDADGDVSTATVTINVAPVDDTPVAVNDTVNATEDTVFNGDVSGNDTLSGDGGNVFSVNTNATNGTVVMNADGTFTYTPNANYNGPDSFTYDLTDADGDVSTATVTINVAPVDDTPVAVNDTVNATEDTVFNGDVSGNDTLSGDGGNVFSVNTNATNGTVVMNADGTFTYTPNANYNGPDSFTYDLTDADGDVSTATVTINVAPVDDTPVAVNDTVNATEDTVFNGDVSGNDTLSGDGGNVFSVNTNATNGTVVMNADGTFTYTPNANYNGPDSFTYDLTDADGDVSTATVTINVAPVDDTPVAVNDTVNATEDTVFNGDVSGNDTLSGDGGNVFSVNTNATNGTVVMNADGTFTYTPNANYNGPDSFTYDLTDADGDVSTATVTINVIPTPDPVNDIDSATEGGANTTGNVLGNDDIGTGPSTVTAVTEGGTPITLGIPFSTVNGGTLTINPDGSYIYSPPPSGTVPVIGLTETFNYTITDNNGNTGSATLIINVVDEGDLVPNAADDAFITAEDTILNSDVSVNDPAQGDGPSTYSAPVTTTNGGTVVMNTDGTFQYTPRANFEGTDTFTYTITDADGDVDTALVTITVNPVNDPSVPVDDFAVTNEGTPVTVNVIANDTDIDGNDATLVSATNGTNGTTSVNPATGEVTYTPNPGFSGPDTFTYTNSEGNTATVTITVNSTSSSGPTDLGDDNPVPENLLRLDDGFIEGDINSEYNSVTAPGAVIDAVRSVNSNPFGESLDVLNADTTGFFDANSVKGSSIRSVISESNTSSVDSLFPLRLGEGDVGANLQDELILETLIYNKTLFLDIDYIIISDPTLEVSDVKVSQSNGDALPDWLVFNDENQQVIGQPPVDAENIRLMIEVELSNGVEVIRYVDIEVQTGVISEFSVENTVAATGTDLFSSQITQVAGEFEKNADAISQILDKG